MNPLRLHTKTTLLVSAITLAMFLATLLVVSVRMINLVREDEKALARLQALSVAEQIRLLPAPHDQENLNRAVSQARAARPNVIAVRVWKQHGKELVVRAAAAADVTTEASLPQEIREIQTAALHDRNGLTAPGALRDFTIRSGRETHYRVFAPLTERDRLYGFVEVAERLDSVPPIVRSFAQTASLLAFVAVVLTMLAIYTLFRYLVYRPMNSLDEAMARVKSGALEAQVPVSTQDEFGRLATGFNRMIERIRDLTREREAQAVTLRERVREATAESNAAAERYRVIFDSNPLPMWVYDPETLAFLTVNEAAALNYGWARGEFLALTLRDLHLPEDIPKLLDQIRQQVDDHVQNREWRHRRKDGTIIDVEVFSHDLIYAGRRARLLIASDVTEKKRSAAGLMRSQRLESLGTLAGGIAHDLNNILAPLSISTFLLRSKVSDASGQQTLDTMEEVVERGSQLVRQVLSFARGAEGERAPLDPRRVLREVVGILKETFPKSIRIQYHEAEASRIVLANPTQIHQVLMNLCVNARDAMPEGGDLEITAADVELDERYSRLLPGAKPGRYVMISVRDTGAGIGPDVLDKIFDPFFTTKEQGKGTGLGLSTSLGIVRSHGGFINVYSEPGTGALFKVYLPVLPVLEANAAAAAQEERAAPPPGKRELILLADDEEPIRRLTRGMLEAANYRAITASDGSEACALYRENRNEISLVLTDMMMPVMDGAAVIEELHRLNPRLPIIASSGLAEVGKQELALSLGAQKFLSKPYTAERLLWALHDLLRADGRDTNHEEKR